VSMLRGWRTQIKLPCSSRLHREKNEDAEIMNDAAVVESRASLILHPHSQRQPSARWAIACSIGSVVWWL
jgi:hypothetical protein